MYRFNRDTESLSNGIFKKVSQKISSDRVALQFILEEVEAASYGDTNAQMFAKNSGFEENQYKNSMNNSFSEVDGPGGPQQTLLSLLMGYMYLNDMALIAQIRIQVVQKIINKYKKGYYQS